MTAVEETDCFAANFQAGGMERRLREVELMKLP